MTPEEERRNEEEAIELVLFRRHYPLTKIGKGVVLLGAVAGVVGGCFAIIGTITGQTIVDGEQQAIANIGVVAEQGLKQSRLNETKLDSMSRRVDRLEEAMVMLIELQCRELRRERAPYLPPSCRKLPP